eukprot:SAG22_NODE_649_length_8157_cov_30.400099_7_plen_452_part_00
MPKKPKGGGMFACCAGRAQLGSNPVVTREEEAARSLAAIRSPQDDIGAPPSFDQAVTAQGSPPPLPVAGGVAMAAPVGGGGMGMGMGMAGGMQGVRPPSNRQSQQEHLAAREQQQLLEAQEREALETAMAMSLSTQEASPPPSASGDFRDDVAAVEQAMKNSLAEAARGPGTGDAGGDDDDLARAIAASEAEARGLSPPSGGNPAQMFAALGLGAGATGGTGAGGAFDVASHLSAVQAQPSSRARGSMTRGGGAAADKEQGAVELITKCQKYIVKTLHRPDLLDNEAYGPKGFDPEDDTLMKFTKMAAFIHTELHDGVVLCQLANAALATDGITDIKLANGQVQTKSLNGAAVVVGTPHVPDEAERAEIREHNISAFLAKCTEVGVPAKDLFEMQVRAQRSRQAGRQGRRAGGRAGRFHTLVPTEQASARASDRFWPFVSVGALSLASEPE